MTAPAAATALRVTLASANDRLGGAAVAASRLHDGLLADGHAARFFVQTQTVADPATVSAKGGLQRSLNRMRSGVDALALAPYNTSPGQFSTSWLPRVLPSLAAAGAADIVHLHWTNAGFLSVSDIAHIAQPVVWTLHDMWAFTGGCHYDDQCGRHAQACGRCPVLHSQSDRDLSARRHAAKRRQWQGHNMTWVAPSRWMAQQAERSAIAQGKRIDVIRNGLDLQRYKPLDRGFARQALRLPADRRLVLFGALNAGGDSRKGYDLLQDALARHAQAPGAREATALVVFGSSPPREEMTHGLRTFHFGHLADDISLALLYAACDVFVAPSRQDNLPNTVAEALACGTPCVAFDIGGLPDLIEHQRNGYLARPFDTEDLAAGIAWCLDTADQRAQHLGAAARRFATEHLDLQQQTQRYVTLYRQLLASPPETPHD